MAPSLSIRKVAQDQLFLNRLPGATRKTFKYCTTQQIFSKSKWYLAGGTALALQVGHRQSVDLDFFTPLKGFSEVSVERSLLASGHWETTFRERGTIYGKLMKTKVSFIAYPFFVPASPMLKCGTVNIITPSDIAAMKIIAVSQRGRKRDFVDIYWYCKNKEPLDEIIQRAIAQYPGQKHNMPHFLKSLTYFADAESDPMPEVFFDADWSKIKKFFEREVPMVAIKLLKLRSGRP